MQNNKNSKMFDNLVLSKGKLSREDILDLSKINISVNDIKSYVRTCKTMVKPLQMGDEKQEDGKNSKIKKYSAAKNAGGVAPSRQRKPH